MCSKMTMRYLCCEEKVDNAWIKEVGWVILQHFGFKLYSNLIGHWRVQMSKPRHQYKHHYCVLNFASATLQSEMIINKHPQVAPTGTLIHHLTIKWVNSLVENNVYHNQILDNYDSKFIATFPRDQWATNGATPTPSLSNWCKPWIGMTGHWCLLKKSLVMHFLISWETVL